MSDVKIDKVSSATAARGEDGQIALSRGERSAMRMWRDEQPGTPKPKASRPYEVLGYAIEGRAELHIEDQVVELAAGDSWVVPAGAEHTYKIIEAFSAVETTTPSA